MPCADTHLQDIIYVHVQTHKWMLVCPYRSVRIQTRMLYVHVHVHKIVFMSMCRYTHKDTVYVHVQVQRIRDTVYVHLQIHASILFMSMYRCTQGHYLFPFADTNNSRYHIIVSMCRYTSTG